MQIKLLLLLLLIEFLSFMRPTVHTVCNVIVPEILRLGPSFGVLDIDFNRLFSVVITNCIALYEISIFTKSELRVRRHSTLYVTVQFM